MQRFYECAKNFKSRIIVRVCADNPLIDAREIDHLIDKFKKGNLTICTILCKQVITLMQMVSVLKYFHMILYLRRINLPKKRDKEHVTTFIRNNRKLFKIKCLEPKLGLNFPYLKFDINTGKDFLKIRKFIHKQKINKATGAKKSLI